MDIRVERLNAAFNASDMTQTELCKKTGITKGAMSSYLSGRYFPKQYAVQKLASALGVSVDYLMGFGVDGSAELNAADTLFIEKYGSDVFELAMKYSRLDAPDKIRASERIDTLLDNAKYEKNTLVGEKAI